MLYVTQRILLISNGRLRPYIGHQVVKHLACRQLFASNFSSNPNPHAKPKELKAKFNTDDPRMPARQRLKNLVVVYGPTAIVLHIGLSLSFLGLTYLIVRYGFDISAFLEQRNILGEKYMMILSSGGTFAIAYALYKAIMPARVLVTLMLTPVVARRLQAFGIIKRRT